VIDVKNLKIVSAEFLMSQMFFLLPSQQYLNNDKYYDNTKQ